MPRTSMLETLLRSAASPVAAAAAPTAPPPPAGTALAAGASHLVEAATTEEALAQVSDQLGQDARIVDARRIRRGGIGGFFAREVVQLHAAPVGEAERARVVDRARNGEVDAPIATGGPSAASAVTGRRSGRGAASPVDRLLADLDDAPDDVDFATYLREQLTPATLTAAAQEAPAPPAGPPAEVGPAPWLRPAVRPESAPAAAEPAATSASAAERWPIANTGWSHDALIRLGLPAQLVRSLEPAPPGDDLAWTAALTHALRPSCRPLPSGPSILVGPRAVELDAFGTDSTVARSKTWLAAVRRDRWVHLVVGGDDWREALDADPIAVSWARPEDLPDAIRCAVEMGLVLGYGPGRCGTRRADPFEVALAVRDLVVTR